MATLSAKALRQFFASAASEDTTCLPCTKATQQSSACATVRESQGSCTAGHARKVSYGFGPATSTVLAPSIEPPSPLATRPTSVTMAAAQVHATASEAGMQDAAAMRATQLHDVALTRAVGRTSQRPVDKGAAARTAGTSAAATDTGSVRGGCREVAHRSTGKMQSERPSKLQRLDSSPPEPAAAVAFGDSSGSRSKAAYAAALQRRRGKAAAACRSSRLMDSTETSVPATAERAQACSNSAASRPGEPAVTSCRESASGTAAASSAGGRNTATSAARPWSDLPEPLVLQVLNYGGNELATTCRRFAGLVRSQRRVLRFAGNSSVPVSTETLLRAIASSPGLRLLEVTAGGGLSGAQLERLSRARSSAFPQKLQVLVLRRCARLTDKGLRMLLLRLRELRCVDLRDCFSLTDEAVAPLGLLPRLERVALGLTSGARGCCRLTCRALTTLFAPERQQQNHGQHEQSSSQRREKVVSGVKFLSLAGCSEMKDFNVLAASGQALEFLDLRGTAIDDSSAPVFASLPNLQVLVLANTAVTTVTVSAILDGCPRLQMLDLSSTGAVSRDCFFRLATSLRAVSRLKLSHVASIDDGLLAHLLAELPCLRCIDVSHCWRVTSAFCEPPFSVAAGIQLRRLGLYSCNVERQKVEAALILAGAPNARLALHNELPLFEMPRVYATMKNLDLC